MSKRDELYKEWLDAVHAKNAACADLTAAHRALAKAWDDAEYAHGAYWEAARANIEVARVNRDDARVAFADADGAEATAWESYETSLHNIAAAEDQNGADR